jgi:hypothetical protein
MFHEKEVKQPLAGISAGTDAAGAQRDAGQAGSLGLAAPTPHKGAEAPRFACAPAPSPPCALPPPPFARRPRSALLFYSKNEVRVK